MRKLVIGALTGALFFAVAAAALALSNNTVTYKATLSQTGKASAKNPANLGIATALDIGTTDGKQPNSAPSTDLYFAKGMILNSKRFASCKASEIDNKPIPAKCEKARIGTGNSNATVGTPGQTPAASETLTVAAFNGNKGKQILLVLNGPGIVNRVIVGTVGKASGKFGYKVTFVVPQALQGANPAQVAVTHLDLTIKSAVKAKVKVGKKTRKVSYLQLSKCSGKKLPTRATVHFNDDTGNKGGPVVTSNGSAACK